ncbi:NgoMIV family type II restriction endonuclease [Streptomyces violascens]|uniref:NgoMIV family type II restriction endonuclease n=1 Tax=Streptomyces violascens TaxID=67381 RepID=UPI00365C0A6B
MPAPFASSLCGYRDGRPNTSDKGDQGSITLGKSFFEAMGIPADAVPPQQAVGNLMAAHMADDLQSYLAPAAPHLRVVPEKPFTSFEQFSHLNAGQELRGDMAADVIRAVNDLQRFSTAPGFEDDVRATINIHLDQIRVEIQQAEERRRQLLNLLGEESLLKLDITVSRAMENPVPGQGTLSHLIAGLSLKWTLRTDRAQDCRSQGSKMAALRRGRMPHFAAVTMEPRPSMLALLGKGSGDIDCVYHLNLPALDSAIEEYCSGTQRKPRLAMRDNFKRLCEHRRVRDYDELRNYLSTL